MQAAEQHPAALLLHIQGGQKPNVTGGESRSTRKILHASSEVRGQRSALPQTQSLAEVSGVGVTDANCLARNVSCYDSIPASSSSSANQVSSPLIT